MNISNALYLFTQELLDASQGVLRGSELHADIYEPIKMPKTIRIDDLRQADVISTGNGIRKDNAVLSIFFFAIPETQAITNRLEARQIAEDMADEWAQALFRNPKLNDENNVPRLCSAVNEIRQFNDWIKPAGEKIPVCVLRLIANPRR